MFFINFHGCAVHLYLADIFRQSKFYRFFSVKDNSFNSVLLLVCKLKAVAAEIFNSVIHKRVVACGNHNAAVCSEAFYKISHRRSRHNA